MFGGNFPLAAAQALSGLLFRHAADAVLAGLVRKQVLTTCRANPQSPDRGQYRFAQNLLRAVTDAVKARAQGRAPGGRRVPRRADEGEDVAKVVAAHYLQAYRCASGGAVRRRRCGPRPWRRCAAVPSEPPRSARR